MLLGVYWYYGFPTGLYHFDFFTFRPGLGGHADGPAELTATVYAPAPIALLDQVRALAARYPEVHLVGDAQGQYLRLTLGGYSLSDYAFYVARELEKVLRGQQATLTAGAMPAGAEFLRLAAPQDMTPPYHSGGILQAVSSSPGHCQAETRYLRLDCHLPLARKSGFVEALDKVCQEIALDVLYYFDLEIGQQVNLMLFFSNGRQGVDGQPLRYTNANSLADSVAQCLAAHGGQPSHPGNYPAHYPKRGPHIVRMVDAAFMLGT
ncbi:hypothetical protein [Hymenobacter glaciei]